MSSPAVNPFKQRPMFNPAGRVVARRELTLTGKVHMKGDEIDAVAHGLSERTLAAWWDQGLIDTLPAVATPAPKSERRR